jgi:hypothetical protein
MAQFENTGEYWAQKAYGTSDNRGKELRRDGFARAEAQSKLLRVWVSSEDFKPNVLEAKSWYLP